MIERQLTNEHALIAVAELERTAPALVCAVQCANVLRVIVSLLVRLATRIAAPSVAVVMFKNVQSLTVNEAPRLICRRPCAALHERKLLVRTEIAALFCALATSRLPPLSVLVKSWNVQLSIVTF